ncbi:MAG: GNAT family N-acetyltransferase [Peptococcaceae bacterium]|jgi:phosphinothricin acetyltransferase|nr:GNAT family N-acetyltransferase [Peptococcaceae bacterium]
MIEVPEIRKMEKRDGEKVLQIYAESIEEGFYTFAVKKPTWEEWDAAHIKEHRLVADYNGEIAGFIALGRLYRHAYFSGVAELSVYVEKKYRRRRIGLALLKALQTDAADGACWVLHSYIFPDNLPSIRLHEKSGFCQVGYHRNIGKKDGRFKDVLVYEYGLERKGELPCRN